MVDGGVEDPTNMEDLKSHAQENILNLVIQTLVDAYAFLRVVDPHVVRKDDCELDIVYLRNRVSHEGLTFLTVMLPKLGDYLDRIVWGEDVKQRVEGFKPYDGLFPVFLRPFWIYFQKAQHRSDSDTAQMYRIMRTFLHGLKKLNLPFDEEKCQERLDSFLAIEDVLHAQDLPTPKWMIYAQRLLEEMFMSYDNDFILPKHGPGAVAGGERHNEKWNFSVLYESVHTEFPYWEYMFPVRSACSAGAEWNLRHESRPLQLAANAGMYRSLRREAEPTARLLLVPKDSRGPRIISCEPKELMYLQQGVAVPLMKFIERHPYTRGHVNFENQSVNASLALSSSLDSVWDTIDMSDASDRVSVQLVTRLFPSQVSRRWLALRSTATVLPDGRKVHLAKFAPMGSALCFPVESLVFWAIVVASIWELTRDPVLARQLVYVYGDDIIVNAKYASSVMVALEEMDLKVNRSKSFHGNHPFRESCGVEAWKGHNVTPLRVKKLPPRRPSDGDAMTAWVKYAELSQYITPLRSLHMLQTVERLVGPIPRVPVPQDFLSIVTTTSVWDLHKFQDPKWSNATSYWSAKLLVVRNRRRHSAISGWSRLQRNLIQGVNGGDPTEVVDRSSTLISKRRVNITYLGISSSQ